MKPNKIFENVHIRTNMKKTEEYECPCVSRSIEKTITEYGDPPAPEWGDPPIPEWGNPPIPEWGNPPVPK